MRATTTIPVSVERITELSNRMLERNGYVFEQSDGCRPLTVKDLAEEYAQSLAPQPPRP